MSKIKYFVFGLSLVLFSGTALSNLKKGGDEKKKTVVKSTPVNFESIKYNPELIKAPKGPIDEGTNDPTVSGLTPIMIDGKEVFTKTTTQNDITVTILYTPK